MNIKFKSLVIIFFIVTENVISNILDFGAIINGLLVTLAYVSVEYESFYSLIIHLFLPDKKNLTATEI